MGKSKFPGKPTKSVMKERVRVLHKNEIIKNCDVSPRQTVKKSRNSIYNECCNTSDVVSNCFHNLSETRTESKLAGALLEAGIKISTEGSVAKGHIKKICGNNIPEDEEIKLRFAAIGSPSYSRDSSLDFKSIPTDFDKLIKKKTVTFKNVPETSDDKSKKTKIHNPLNKGPLISIMKKDCRSSKRYVLRGNSIVRPSRLTEILKNSENIDKTNSLSFRTMQISNSLKKQKMEATHTLSKDVCSGRESLDDKTTLFCESESQSRNTKQLEKLQDKSIDKWQLNDTYELGNEVNRLFSKRNEGTIPNKTILRQPRLYIEPRNEEFPNLNHNVPTTSDTILLSPLPYIYSACGVCNSTLNNEASQNQKYGIMSCDACRKCLSKITKKTIPSPSSPFTTFKIQCNKRNGECAIPQRNTMKSLKKINDERCSTCWLNKCVNSFHLSSEHKLRLNAILSETHKIKTESKIKSLLTVSPSIKHFRNEVSTMDCNQTSGKTTELSWTFKSTHSSDIFSGNNTDLTMDIWLQPKTCPPKVFSDDSGIRMNDKNGSNPIMIHKTPTNMHSDSEATNLSQLSDYPKRQKIDFRGPRVKHVCRSASIALGQQIARFSNGYEDKSNFLQQNTCTEENLLKNSLFGNIYNFSKNVSGDIAELRKRLEVDDNNFQPLNNCKSAPQSKSISVSSNPFAETENSLDKKVTQSHENNDRLQKPKQRTNENRKAFMLTRHSLESLAKRNLMRMTKIRSFEKKSKLISIEFWDNYIPAEVNETGFGIILTETLPIFALCFLCGSMDLENLYFCASCCEPYHSYCIQEDNIPDKNKNIDGQKAEKLLGQLNWVCPRCTVCYTCNMSSGSKIKCQKCNKNYHSTCMGTSKGLLGADRPLICRSCLKCQTCSTSKVSKYVGSQPICMHCFKMSKSESRCPLCNNTFDDILDVTILKCGVCEKFIHAKCEGLTEVQSNLQSNLPENIKFACKKCSLENDYAKTLAKNWREAVVEELKCGLLDILKLLSRSRQANILRNSRSKCVCDFEPTKINSKSYSKNNEGNDTIEDQKDNVNIYNRYSNYLCSGSNFYSSDVPKSPNLYDIRKKVIDKKYITLVDFNADMNDVLLPVKNDELILTYKEILSEKFSWFQNETKTCTDALEEDMFESNSFFPVDDVATEDLYVTLKLPESARQILHNLHDKKDTRTCILCQKKGDGKYLHESRLLYCGFNTWVHANCIAWSNCVYEEFDGTIQNVEHALRSGRLTKCLYCNLQGATIGCSFSKCCNYFHFICAIKANCVFSSNKLVRCSNHNTKHTNVNFTENKDIFNVCRPLYVNFDKTLRKHVEPCKVQFMLGSLAVVQLGSICPKYSDTSEAIVPINFVCTRLYWSSKEPWKIVKYNVQTSIEHLSIDNDITTHFTVDHSQNVNLVENQLSQIVSWQKSLSREDNLDGTLHHDFRQFGDLRASADNETNSDEYVEEEPQNHSDLLPPEIKDAIFEDLPHDILDGISMLDIFPKLMIYEDMLAVDAKSEKSPNEIYDNTVVQSTSFVNHLEENNTVQSMYARRELQPSKQEGFIRNVDAFRNQPCSSSLTLNSKFETTRGYLSKRLSENVFSDIQPCNAKINYFGNTSDCFRENIKKQKLKLIQLDGTDDIFLDHIHSQNYTKNKPVNCETCHCIYKTRDSFQRHLLHCVQLPKTEGNTETLSKSHVGDFIQNTIPIQSCIRDNEETRNLTAVTNSSLISKPIISQHRDVISDYHDGLLKDCNTTADNGLKLYANSIDKVCEETGWESCGLVEFGVVNKSKQINSNYNFVDINSKISNERFKDYSCVKPEFTLIPDTLNTISNKPEYIPPIKHNHLPFLNHHLVLNNHFTQKEEQNQQQQFVVIQQSNNQPLFLHQVSNAQSVPQNIFPVVLANNSVQYTSMQPSTNPLMQGSIFQADTSGNIIISSGLQMLPMASLQLSAQSSPQLIGAFNQPQSLHLGQNQMFIGGTTTMDILPNSNQVLLTTSPVYYGLETIVQNTVMSSQQFVSTAMQGVLSQNASFSATTTQVFQSSKFEPVNETQSNYVVLNSTDGSAVVVPQTNVLTGFVNTSSDYQSSYSHDFANIYSAHHQNFMQETQSNNVMPIISSLTDMPSVVIGNPINQIQSAGNVESNSHITSSRKLTVKLTSSIKDLSSKNTMNLSNQNCSRESLKIDNIVMKKISSIPKVNHKTTKRCKNYKVNKINSSPNSTNLFKSSATATQINEVSVYNADSISGKNQLSEQKCGSNVPCFLVNANNKSVNNKHYIQSETRNLEHLIDTSNISKNEKDDNKRILQITKNKSPSQLYSINSSKLPPTSLSFGCSLNNVPTNIVAPTLQIQQNSNTTARPTNRVLPMQSIPKRSVDKLTSNSKNILNKLIENSLSEVDHRNIKRKSEDINVNIQDKIAFLNEQKSKETHFYSNSEDFLGNSNKNDDSFLFKTNNDEVIETNRLSKSAVEENYEISVTGHNVTLTDRIFPDKEKVNTNEKVEKNKYIKCLPSIDRGNNLDHLAATVPKKKIEVKEMKTGSEPHLIYEIQSEDGFSYKSESIAEIWETVFEAVQSARRAHGLSTLPIGPFADMCGVQMIGLKANALKYIIEQLPGNEGCTKYTPKYHKHKSVSRGIEHIHYDQENEFENLYGAGRCEPFTKKSEYDIFSWLASKHRKQPKQIFVQPLDTELIIRRCNTNLPMAMKYRTLKETCKQNVGVFRSLIHGRGLFCTKDIEAGEMVIEYAGELIRSTLTDKRERFYDSKGIGCYMFKIDDNFVVDATMRGNAARFINHSCEPNCYSKVVDILGHKHIIIFSLRRIVQGEELTYDYKFPFEDIKIPCSCGSRKCRRYLN